MFLPSQPVQLYQGEAYQVWGPKFPVRDYWSMLYLYNNNKSNLNEMIVPYVLNYSAFYSQTWYAGWRFPITSEEFWLPKQNKFLWRNACVISSELLNLLHPHFLYWCVTRKNIQQNVFNFVSPQNFTVKVTGGVVSLYVMFVGLASYEHLWPLQFTLCVLIIM